MGVFIAVALILVLMSTLFFYMLKGAMRRLGKFSKLNMIHEANVYDELLENKEIELKALLKQIETEQAKLAEEAQWAVQAHGGEARAGTSNFFTLLKGRYLDKDFTTGYQALRNQFSVDKDACVQSVIASSDRRTGGNPAQEILDAISIEMRYRLSLLEREEAFALLRESFSRAQTEQIDDFIGEEPTGDVIAFFDWLSVRSFTNSPEVVVRSGNPNDTAGVFSGNVTAEFDPSVCEGVYVIAGGRMHDFSIRSREISG